LNHPLINSVIQFLVNTTPGLVILILVGFFDALFIGLVLTRKTTKHIVEDLGLARHVLVTWFIVPFFWGYILLLKGTGRIVVTVNGTIPWEEDRLAFVGNHAMRKLQDTFLMPIIIFNLNPDRVGNPIRYFPFTMADTENFFDSRFFKWLVGRFFLISVNRTKNLMAGAKSVLEACKKRWAEYSGSLITNIEGTRTQKAKKLIISKKGSRLGEPTRGIAMLALETNTPMIPYWGRIVEVSYRSFSVEGLILAPIWKLIGWLLKRRWRKIGFYESRPKACPETVLWGLLELGLNPKIKTYIDINHPKGPVRPRIGRENSRELTQRYVETLLSLGDYQLERIEGSRKK